MTKTALEVMESSKKNLEMKVDRLRKRISGGSQKARLDKKIEDVELKIAKLMNEKYKLQDQIADLVEDTIDSEAVKKEIAELEQSIGEYDRAIATLKQ